LIEALCEHLHTACVDHGPNIRWTMRMLSSCRIVQGAQGADADDGDAQRIAESLRRAEADTQPRIRTWADPDSDRVQGFQGEPSFLHHSIDEQVHLFGMNQLLTLLVSVCKQFAVAGRGYGAEFRGGLYTKDQRHGAKETISELADGR